jgi:hypothetical protein
LVSLPPTLGSSTPAVGDVKKVCASDRAIASLILEAMSGDRHMAIVLFPAGIAIFVYRTKHVHDCGHIVQITNNTAAVTARLNPPIA